MTTPLTTPSPFLRDRLLTAADGLRKDAETATLNLAEAEQDLAAAKALLAEAEAQHARARAEVDGIEAGIAWAEQQAREITAQIDADPFERLAATGLMVEARKEIPQNTRTNWPCPVCGGELAWVGEHYDELAHVATGLEACPDDDLTAPGVVDSRAEVARTPDQVDAAFAPPAASEPAPDGPPVARSGPGITMPDLGPKRPPLDPPPGKGTHTHAKPGGLARVTGGWPVVGRRRKNDEQDGDA